MIWLHYYHKGCKILIQINLYFQGYADGLDVEESLNILQNTCKSEDNVLAYKSVYDLKYTIPKRENCGTYKPKNTNITSRCFCDDIYDPRKMKIIFSQIIDRHMKFNSE